MGLVGVFDDSGTHGGEVCVLGGLLASAEAWEVFTEEWRLALEQPKGIKYLKMKEANALEGEFLGFTDEERDNKLRTLSDVAGKHAIYASVAMLRHTDFRRAFKGISRKKIGPYALLFHKIIFDTARFALDRGLQGPLDFVFDEQGKPGQRCADAYPRMKKHLSSEMRDLLGGIPTFRNDKVFLPLQASDALAWIWRRHGEAESLSRFSALMIHPFISGLSDKPAALTVLTQGDLLARRQYLVNPPGEGLNP